MYTEKQLVAVAKRENNTKRNYLVVNRLQGKHVPVSPGEAMQMFEELAAAARERYGAERTLVIGFAETATAIGAAVAAELGGWYIQTTREPIYDTAYFSFSELHSHAVEQTLARGALDEIMPNVDRILLAEDEVTTGRTILNIVDVLEQAYGKKAFAAVSLLNGMDASAEMRFAEKGIDLVYLVKTNHKSYEAKAEQYQGDGACFAPMFSENSYSVLEIGGYINARRLTEGEAYRKACAGLWEKIHKAVPDKGCSILVLGTEEFMYPALLAAREMEKLGHYVRFHATTRSPILPGSEESYPLHRRYELKSPYDAERATYVYELAEYDEVFVMTDAPRDGQGIAGICGTLEYAGNRKIQLVRWCGR